MTSLGITAKDLKIETYDKFLESNEKDMIINSDLPDMKQEKVNKAKYHKRNRTIYGMYLRILDKIIETQDKEKKIKEFQESRAADEKKSTRNNRCTFISLSKP